MLKAQQVVGFVIAGVVGGFVIAGVAGGFVLAGVAPLVQVCSQDEPQHESQDEQGQLTLLGEGGCRTADGGHGEPITISAVSFDQCNSKCFGMNGQCSAFEYNSNNNSCEIHSGPITTFEKVAGVSCYQRE
jgi:PAN domain